MEPCRTDQPRADITTLHLLPAHEVDELASVAKALSDPIRLQMVHLLGQCPDLCTCEFEGVLGLGQSNVSYHLKILLDAGIVEREVFGTWSHYRLRASGILSQFTNLVTNTRQPELSLR